MTKGIKVLGVILGLLMTPGSVFAQDAAEQSPANTTDAFVVESVQYELTGRTKEPTLRYYFGSYEQKGFSSEEELTAFIDKETINLLKSHYFNKAAVTEVSRRRQGNQTLITLNVMVKDSFPVIPIPYVMYSSSNGFDAYMAAILNNTGGKLFDMMVFSSLNFPIRGQSVSWKDPTWSVGTSFSKIKAGEVLLGFSVSFFDKRQFIVDRGNEVFGYRSKQLNGSFSTTWDFADYWQLVGSIGGTYTFTNRILVQHNDFNYGVPTQFTFTPKLSLSYDRAPWIDGVRAGQAARLSLSYLLSDPIETQGLSHDMAVNAKYGHFWKPTSFFFPQVVAEFYYKTGVPDFAMGSFIDGIIDNQWRGNGGFYLSSSYRFKIADWDKVMQVQLGPMLNYGVVFEPGRKFDVSDQGFTTGVQLALFFDPLPNLPIIASLGFDLRQRNDNPKFSKRIEFAMSGSFSF